MTDAAADTVPPAAAPAHAHGHAHEALAACPNCGVSLRLPGLAPEAVRHCPGCGQETTLHPPSVAEFAHEFVGHYVALEGPLWRTLFLLVRHPGQLTAEYLAGRRRRYVIPLRLYLSASFVLFLVLKLLAPTGTHPGPHAADVPAAPAASAARAAPAASTNERVIVLDGGHARPSTAAEARRLAEEHARTCERDRAACGWYERSVAEASVRWASDPQGAQAAFFLHALGVAPYAMFLMLPVFAGVVALAYRNRRRLFGEHLVFVMHGQAFAFLLTAALALATPSSDGGLAFFVMPFYGFVALRRVYGGRRLPTLLRLVAVSAVCLALFAAVTTALAFWFFIH